MALFFLFFSCYMPALVAVCSSAKWSYIFPLSLQIPNCYQPAWMFSKLIVTYSSRSGRDCSWAKPRACAVNRKKKVLSCLLHFSFYAPIVNAFFPPSTDPYKLVSLFRNGMATPQVSNCHGVPSECMTRINHVAYLGLDCEYSSFMGVFSFLARPRIFFTYSPYSAC